MTTISMFTQHPLEFRCALNFRGWRMGGRKGGAEDIKLAISGGEGAAISLATTPFFISVYFLFCGDETRVSTWREPPRSFSRLSRRAVALETPLPASTPQPSGMSRSRRSLVSEPLNRKDTGYIVMK
ncbi:hypothetical protein NPIL_660201 [Nephila pilipes]|uniref:Uncharacterized protein n=1 Tax=Nephila pilipes TaxID=299642 RepID=A0A8X6MCZ9_NEPPI|nr:hypothetical protein NPIL_660201 [Nephila pilipes]